jgi:hypothetical protein
MQVCPENCFHLRVMSDDDQTFALEDIGMVLISLLKLSYNGWITGVGVTPESYGMAIDGDLVPDCQDQVKAVWEESKKRVEFLIKDHRLPDELDREIRGVRHLSWANRLFADLPL